MKPLKGIKVLDLSQFVAGPYCALMLSDMGAEVIKLENPPLGDQSRFAPIVEGNTSTNYTCRNRGKKSAIMNLKDERQKELLFELIKTSDVIISNFRVGAMEKLGLGYDVVKNINPRIVYTMISGFGQVGPLKDHTAFDGVVQAMSGVISTTGEPGGEPVKTGISLADICSGAFAAVGTLAVLNQARTTGIGSRVDVSMMDVLVSMQDILVANYCLTGAIPVPVGNRHPTACPNRVFELKNNERMFITCATEGTFPKFCEMLGHPELAENPKFMGMQNRMRNHKELEEILEEILINWDRDEFSGKMDEYGLPYGPINNIKQVVESEQVKQRNLLVNANYPNGQSYRTTGCALKFNDMQLQTDYDVYPIGYNTFDVFSSFADEQTLHEIFDESLAACQSEAEMRYGKRK